MEGSVVIAMGDTPVKAPIDLTCKYCNARFKTERGASKHSCKRMQFAEGIGGLSAARAYDLFTFWYIYNGFSTKKKTFEAFSRSPYFSLFVKLVGYCERAAVTNAREYVRWLADNRIPSKRWLTDETLCQHRLKLHEREDALSAAIRSVDRIVIWTGAKGHHASQFFNLIGPGELIDWIKTGKLSPWVLLISERGEKALESLSEEQMHSLAGALDVKYWIDVFLERMDTVEKVKDMLDTVGLLKET